MACSLRAKLTHALELLRTYQHKLRVLDATLEVTASRPTTPTHPRSSQLGSLATRSAGCAADQQLLPVPLSPITEGSAEGGSPSSSLAEAVAAMGRHHLPAHGMGAYSIAMDLGHGSSDATSAVQPPLLKLLAQALVQAQAEVLGQQQQWGAVGQLPIGPPHQGQPISLHPLRAVTEDGMPTLLAGSTAGAAVEEYNPGSMLPPGRAASPGSICSQPTAQQSQFIIGGGISEVSEAPAAAAPSAGGPGQEAWHQPPRAVLAHWQPSAATPRAPLQFDASLMDLVDEVEQMHTAGYTRTARPASGACRQSAAPHMAEVQGLLADLFEENDVCLLINGL